MKKSNEPESGASPSELIDALHSTDALVRDTAAVELTFNTPVNAPISAALRQALSLPDVGTCGHCGASFSGRGLQCDACHRPLPDPRTLIARLARVSLLPNDEEPIDDWIGLPVVSSTSEIEESNVGSSQL